MKSLQLRLTVWFTLSCLALVTAFTAITHHVLELELRTKQVGENYPEHPDWKLHGQASEEEVRDILEELLEANLIWGIPILLVATGLGYFIARKSLRPVASLNQQLQNIEAQELSRRIELGEMDAEFREMVGHLNDLLTRLESSFTDISEYSAKVAHELRTPLAIMRLKVEMAGERIPAELSEDLQAAIHQLTHVVDQFVLLAKAEQGRLKIQISKFNLDEMVEEIAEDFSLLAQESGRKLSLKVLGAPCQAVADSRYMRQIIHNLLSNALKHGSGDLTLRVGRHRHFSRLTIANQVNHAPNRSESTLGIGLRVVSRLLHQQPGVHHRQRRGRHYYVCQLTLPVERTGPNQVQPAAK